MSDCVPYYIGTLKIENRSVATYPSAGGRCGAHGCIFQERNTRGVATNVYLRKTSEKPEKT